MFHSICPSKQWLHWLETALFSPPTSNRQIASLAAAVFLSILSLGRSHLYLLVLVCFLFVVISLGFGFLCVCLFRVFFVWLFVLFLHEESVWCSSVLMPKSDRADLNFLSHTSFSGSVPQNCCIAAEETKKYWLLYLFCKDYKRYLGIRGLKVWAIQVWNVKYQGHLLSLFSPGFLQIRGII